VAAERGFAKLVPELICSDLVRSLRFYTEVVGFRVVYERREEIRGLRFVYEPPDLRFFQARFEPI